MKTEFASHRIRFRFPGGFGVRYQYNDKYDPKRFSDCLEVWEVREFKDPVFIIGTKLWLYVFEERI